MMLSVLLLLLLPQVAVVSAFHVASHSRSHSHCQRTQSLTSIEMAASRNGRREFLVVTTATTASAMATTTSSSLSLSFLLYPTAAVHAAPAETSVTSLSDLLVLITEARSQLNGIPKLIETEKWDSVRAILIKPPLSDCWAKTARPLLPQYAEAIGNANGDELAALEAKEELSSHLRYLDMAVYNNNFNPIKSEGTNGASKELVRSYYEDPTNEWKASVQAFDQLIQLAADN
ncbi:hypothetical protein MHU86_21537 [Fragilaria crotonensis]|nr:hypothetical protein MHU86_21537 [Fragilaria crotonensis]